MKCALMLVMLCVA